MSLSYAITKPSSSSCSGSPSATRATGNCRSASSLIQRFVTRAVGAAAAGTRLLVFQIRLNIVEGNYDAAVGRLQVGYALARHTAVEPTIVSGLVGVSIASMMDDVRLDLLQRRDVPSLLWAETFLPRPLIDPRPGLEAEMYGVEMSFPALRDVERTPEEWNAEFLELMRELPELLAMTSNTGEAAQHWEKVLAAAAVLGQTVARRDELRTFVARCGKPAEKVERMTDPQLLLEFTRLKFEQLRDDMFRWTTLPYPESRAHLEAAEARLKEAKADGEARFAARRDDSARRRPGAVLLCPCPAASRRLDVLRILEALRIHLSRHDGALPKSLAEITDLRDPRSTPSPANRSFMPSPTASHG